MDVVKCDHSRPRPTGERISTSCLKERAWQELRALGRPAHERTCPPVQKSHDGHCPLAAASLDPSKPSQTPDRPSEWGFKESIPLALMTNLSGTTFSPTSTAAHILRKVNARAALFNLPEPSSSRLT